MPVSTSFLSFLPLEQDKLDKFISYPLMKARKGEESTNDLKSSQFAQ